MPPDPRVTAAALAAACIALLTIWLGTAAMAADPEPQPVLTLPVEDGRIVEVARLPEQRWLSGHRGVDIAAPPGSTVVSPGTGVVVFAGSVAGRSVMTIALDVGVNATLEPVSAEARVGDRVRQGQTVGVVEGGPGHCAPRTCIHWGIRVGRDYHDPLDWLLGYGPVILLPVT